jgi:O-acetylhomoserine (thiol)-lyase
MKGFNSKAVHGNMTPDQFNSLRMPVYDNNAFDFASSQDIADAFQGKLDAYSYSRVSNPTISAYEQRINLITGAKHTIGVSSGMAAITNTVLALVETGDNIITTPFLFGHTYSFFTKNLANLGIETRLADFNDPSTIADKIDGRTRLIFFENVTNPQLYVFDIKKISDIAKNNGVALIVDNTLPTPYLFKAKDFGVDVELFSNTKAISGGATTVGGSIVIYDSDKWSSYPSLNKFHDKFKEMALIKKLRKEIYRNFGACLTPHNASMQLLGLETLSLRLERSAENTIQIVAFLKENSEVKSISYPGVSDSPYYNLVKSQFNGNGGSMILFEMDSQEACFTFMDRLQMIRRATNFCDNKSLIIHPYSTIYSEYDEAQCKKLDINDKMIRLSVGIEDIQDLLDDLAQAFDK